MITPDFWPMADYKIHLTQSNISLEEKAEKSNDIKSGYCYNNKQKNAVKTSCGDITGIMMPLSISTHPARAEPKISLMRPDRARV